MKLVVSGTVKIGARTQKFAKNVDAKDDADAREQSYSLFGSEHGATRRQIVLVKVEKAK
jgi:ribosomal protein L20A (L18A)